MKRYRTIVADPPWRYTKDPGALRAKRGQARQLVLWLLAGVGLGAAGAVAVRRLLK